MEAFYDGYSCLESNDWEFIVKLDGDLSFGSDYFEKCFKEFESDPKLGIGEEIFIIYLKVNWHLKKIHYFMFVVQQRYIKENAGMQ